jgi:hypothetical protein
MPSHLCLAHYGPGLNRYQSGACIVRQAQEQTGPEYICPCTVPSKPAVTPAASQVHNNVRWSEADMETEARPCKGLHPKRGGTAQCLLALAE